MIDFKLPIDLPAVDLSSALPLLALIIIVALILIALLARSIVRSRLIVIALIIALVMGGSSVIVGGLQALTGLLAVAGLIALAVLVLIARQPVLLDLTREVIGNLQRESTPIQWPRVIDQPTHFNCRHHLQQQRFPSVTCDQDDYRKAWGFEP